MIFCFELGVFLLVFPLAQLMWDMNSLSTYTAWLADNLGQALISAAPLSGLGLAEHLYLVPRNPAADPRSVESAATDQLK